MIKKILKIALAVTLVGLFIWTLYFLFNKSQKAPVTFQTIQAFDTTIVKKTVATGSIIPRKEINMKSQVSGIIEKLYVVAGQQVKQGDVIAKVKIIPNMVNLSNAENRVNQAKISFDNAKMDFERNQNLLTQGAISKVEFQQYELKTLSKRLSAVFGNLETEQKSQMKLL